MIDASKRETRSGEMTGPFPKVRDVADFHLRWHEFRPIALRLGRTPGLSEAETDTLGWMIELLDRIGPNDLERDDS